MPSTFAAATGSTSVRLDGLDTAASVDLIQSRLERPLRMGVPWGALRGAARASARWPASWATFVLATGRVLGRRAEVDTGIGVKAGPAGDTSKETISAAPRNGSVPARAVRC